MRLNKDERNRKTSKISLNDHIANDGKGNYLIGGLPLPARFVELIGYNEDSELPFIILCENVSVSQELVQDWTKKEICIRVHRTNPYESALIPVRVIEKIKIEESRQTTLIPQFALA